MWSNGMVLIVMGVFLTTVIISGGVDGQGGMQPVSEVKDESTDPQEELKQKVKDAKEKAKIAAHIQIATSHLKEVEEEEPSGEVGDSKVTRKDKAPNLQNSAKHSSDTWLLNFLLEQWSSSSASVNDQVEILENLENFSHKFENGRDLFQATPALKTILVPALNSTHKEIRRAACGVFAIAAQNNEVVQTAALNHGVIRHLVHLLSDETSVRTKALFAIASLLRNHHEAQKKFIQDGGVSALVRVAFYSETRKRVLTLVADLLTERQLCLKDVNRSSDDADLCDRRRILEATLKSHDWCDVLTDSIRNIPGFDLDDQIQTVTVVGVTLNSDLCKEQMTPFANVFHRLLEGFAKDGDFEGVATTLKEIIAIVDTKAEKPNHTEL